MGSFIANPVLDHLDQKMDELHPLARRALVQGLPQFQPPAAPAPAPAPMLGAPPEVPAEAGSFGAAPAPATPAPFSARPVMHGITPAEEPPEQTARIKELSRLESSPSGISQIGGEHPNFGQKLLRGLGHTAEAVGSMFGPTRVAEAFIPGTQLHHNMLVGQAAGAVKRGEDVENEEQKRQLEAAQAEHLGTEASAPHTVTTAEGIMQFNPDTKRYDIPVGAAPVKEEQEGKTVTTDQGVMQYDPKTHTYSIRVGGAPEKEAKAGTIHQLEDGTLIMAHPDGTATPVTINGEPAKGKATVEPLENRIVKEYMDKHPGATLAQARRATEANPPDKGQNFVDPKTNKLLRVEPGGTVPQGATTPNQYGSLFTPSGTTKSRAEQASAVIQAGDNLTKLIDDPKYKPMFGNLESYWNQVINGTPIADPAASRMMAEIGSYVALQPAMHGFRSSEALREFAKLIGGIPKNPAALKEAIRGIRDTASVVQGTGGRPGTGGGNTNPKDPAGIL